MPNCVDNRNLEKINLEGWGFFLESLHYCVSSPAMVEVMYIHKPQRPPAKKKKSLLKQTGAFQITPALR